MYLDEIINSKEYLPDICKSTGTVLGFFGGMFLGYRLALYLNDAIEK